MTNSAFITLEDILSHKVNIKTKLCEPHLKIDCKCKDYIQLTDFKYNEMFIRKNEPKRRKVPLGMNLPKNKVLKKIIQNRDYVLFILLFKHNHKYYLSQHIRDEKFLKNFFNYFDLDVLLNCFYYEKRFIVDEQLFDFLSGKNDMEFTQFIVPHFNSIISFKNIDKLETIIKSVQKRQKSGTIISQNLYIVLGWLESKRIFYTKIQNEMKKYLISDISSLILYDHF